MLSLNNGCKEKSNDSPRTKGKKETYMVISTKCYPVVAFSILNFTSSTERSVPQRLSTATGGGLGKGRLPRGKLMSCSIVEAPREAQKAY